jgi:hypothetical protein
MIETIGAEATTRSFVGEYEIPLEELHAYELLPRPSNDKVIE